MSEKYWRAVFADIVVGPADTHEQALEMVKAKTEAEGCPLMTVEHDPSIDEAEYEKYQE